MAMPHPAYRVPVMIVQAEAASNSSSSSDQQQRQRRRRQRRKGRRLVDGGEVTPHPSAGCRPKHDARTEWCPIDGGGVTPHPSARHCSKHVQVCTHADDDSTTYNTTDEDSTSDHNSDDDISPILFEPRHHVDNILCSCFRVRKSGISPKCVSFSMLDADVIRTTTYYSTTMGRSAAITSHANLVWYGIPESHQRTISQRRDDPWGSIAVAISRATSLSRLFGHSDSEYPVVWDESVGRIYRPPDDGVVHEQ